MSQSAKGDTVDHPSHYTAGGIEVIDAIEAWELGFCLGNAVKYIARAGKKDPDKELEDLRKAAWYLDREIARRELLDTMQATERAEQEQLVDAYAHALNRIENECDGTAREIANAVLWGTP